MELSKYLLPSHSVEVTTIVQDENHKSSELILRTVIEKGLVDDSFIIIAPIYHGKIFNFQLQDVVEIAFSAPDGSSKDIYAIKCRIQHRNFSNNMSTLTLKVISEPKKIQRRQAFRVKIFATYPFKYRDSYYELVTKDISSTGLLALTTIQLQKNAIFEIDFDANIKPKDALDTDYSLSKVFKIRCKVLDSIPQVEIRRYLNRIQFEGLTETESKYLIQYLYAKQTEIMHLDPNFSQKISAYFEHESDQFEATYTKEYRRLQIFSLISLVSLFISLVMLLFSRPKKMYVLDYFFDFYRPQFWDQDYLLGSMVIACLVLLLDVIGLAFNFIEIKKNNSSLHWTLLVTLMIALGIIVFVTSIAATNGIPLF